MINLSASGGSVTFEFIGNSGYLQDGTITVPVNSLSMIIDESDMVTFRKPNNDVFISALLSEFGMTKEEMIAWYKANMVGSTGGSGGGITSGEVQTMIDESISGKADAASAVTNVRILTVSQQNSLQIEQRINNDYQFVGNVYKIGSGLTWDYSTKEIEVDNSTVALKTDLSGKLDVSAYTPVTIDSAITSNSTNAVQSSAIYDKVTISVEEIGTATGSSSDRMVSNEYNYSDGVFSYSADNFSIEEQGLYPWLQYNDGESTKMLMFSAGTVDTDDYSYTLSGNSLYVEFKGANRILEMHFVVVNGQTMTYSYSYVGGQSIQWLKDYVSALEARVKILEQNNT